MFYNFRHGLLSLTTGFFGHNLKSEFGGLLPQAHFRLSTGGFFPLGKDRFVIQRLLQREHMFPPIISLQRLGDGFTAGLYSTMAQGCQFHRIPFAFQNGIYNRIANPLRPVMLLRT